MKKKLTIGITCYPSVGGSGIVATQLGIELAHRGYDVHFISYERPFRLAERTKNIYFHKVPVSTYQLFRYPDYTLPLAVTMADVHQKFHLDLMHVHYAVPHATAAVLARQIIVERNKKAFRIVTTLHGTDITLVGRDASLHPIICYSIEQSNGITAVSKSLADETKEIFKISKHIEVIHNFYTPKKITKSRDVIRRQLKVGPDDFVISHASNLRPVKRIPDLLKITANVRKKYPVKLLVLAGDSFNPYRALVAKYNLTKHVIVKNDVSDVENYLSASDVGLYTSDHESFGMSILETMSYGRAVLATRAGGVPEVVIHGKTGLLYEVGDVSGFTAGITKLINETKFRQQLADNGLQRAKTFFSTNAMVDRYIEYYEQAMSK